jgi:hypothetical protein
MIQVEAICEDCPLACGCEVHPLSDLCIQQLHNLKEGRISKEKRLLNDVQLGTVGQEGLYYIPWTDSKGFAQVTLYDGKTDNPILTTDPPKLAFLSELLKKLGFTL